MLNQPISSIKSCTILATALLLALYARAEDSLATRAQALLDDARERHNVAGITAGIAHNGEIVWLGGTGFRDIENQIPATPDMIHRIASISKPMTAVAAMKLKEYGRLTTEDPLRKFVPEWPESPMGEIKIVHLLTHTSGIKHYTGDDNRPFTHYDTLADAVHFIMNRKSGVALPPQDRYIYTTYGYAVLGLVVERASGVPFADFMRDYVWLPAGMRDTSMEVSGEVVARKSKLYRHNANGELEEDDYTDLSSKSGGGGMQSTAGDLLRFAVAFEGESLLTRETMDEMMVIPPLNNPRTDERPSYGFGWNIGTSESLGNYIAHSGGQSGTSTYLMILRDHDIAISVICNTANTSATAELVSALGRLAAGVPEPTAN